MIVETGKLYQHKTKGSVYRVIDHRALIKDGPAWKSGVIYKDENTGFVYVRFLPDFCLYFREVSENK